MFFYRNLTGLRFRFKVVWLYYYCYIQVCRYGILGRIGRTSSDPAHLFTWYYYYYYYSHAKQPSAGTRGGGGGDCCCTANTAARSLAFVQSDQLFGVLLSLYRLVRNRWTSDERRRDGTACRCVALCPTQQRHTTTDANNNNNNDDDGERAVAVARRRRRVRLENAIFICCLRES